MEPAEGSSGKKTKELGPNKKQRKNRSQVQILQDAFYVERHPSPEMKAELAERTGLTVEQVQAWFVNRRAYDRSGPRQRRPSNENFNDGRMEGEVVLALPAPRALSLRRTQVTPPQADSLLTASTNGTELPPRPSKDLQG